MSLKMSRRGFVKASAVATASTLLLGASATAAAPTRQRPPAPRPTT
ncbi:twin-arginine translocation signal domain-containing protein [Eggerthella lenta]|nr:twin-arginine translocation signal domain-containing protein [Eggerthella lenta]